MSMPVSRPWPRWAGALAGLVFMLGFVVVPEGNKLGWAASARDHLIAIGLLNAVLGAVLGWLLVVARNRLMITR